MPLAQGTALRHYALLVAGVRTVATEHSLEQELQAVAAELPQSLML